MQRKLVKATADQQIAAIFLFEGHGIVAGVDFERKHAVEPHVEPQRNELGDVAITVRPDHIDAVLPQHLHYRLDMGHDPLRKETRTENGTAVEADVLPASRKIKLPALQYGRQQLEQTRGQMRDHLLNQGRVVHRHVCQTLEPHPVSDPSDEGTKPYAHGVGASSADVLPGAQLLFRERASGMIWIQEFVAERFPSGPISDRELDKVRDRPCPRTLLVDQHTDLVAVDDLVVGLLDNLTIPLGKGANASAEPLELLNAKVLFHNTMWDAAIGLPHLPRQVALFHPVLF